MYCYHIVNDSEETFHVWPFVYLHGEVESLIGHKDCAPDMFFATEPMPTTPGTYYGRMYDGQPVIIMLAEHLGCLGGRAALLTDTEALRHVISPEDWG